MIERNLDLTPRQENNREKQIGNVIEFELSDIKKHFSENIKMIRDNSLLIDDLRKKGENDCADELLRAQIVFLESALDFYIHEITQYSAKKCMKMYGQRQSGMRIYKLV